MSDKHIILAIDDDEAEVRPKIPEALFRLEVVDPTDGAKFTKRVSEHIGSASLILLDHKFRDQAPTISLEAQDGASLVSHLRSWSRSSNQMLPPIVMFTNETAAYANEVPTVGPATPLNGSFQKREHRLAPSLDVEWVLFKEAPDATDRIIELANSFVAIQKVGGKDGISLEELQAVLKLPSAAVWTPRAYEELQTARPPINQKDGTEPTRGASQVIRWLCQKSLPYPGLFISDLYAAWALGLSLPTFERLIAAAPSTEWLKGLREAEYVGPLSRFLGRRWWRSGVNQLIWQLDEATGKVDGRKAAFDLLAPDVRLDDLYSPSSHVVACDEDFLENEIVDIACAVQLHPPGWPAEALEPWMKKEDVLRDKILMSMADPSELAEVR